MLFLLKIEYLLLKNIQAAAWKRSDFIIVLVCMYVCVCVYIYIYIYIINIYIYIKANAEYFSMLKPRE